MEVEKKTEGAEEKRGENRNERRNFVVRSLG